MTDQHVEYSSQTSFAWHFCINKILSLNLDKANWVISNILQLCMYKSITQGGIGGVSVPLEGGPARDKRDGTADSQSSWGTGDGQ